MPSTNKEETTTNSYRLTLRFGDIMEDGHTVLPNVLLKYQSALDINAFELNFIAQVWYHWWSEKDAFPGLSTIAKRMGRHLDSVRSYSRSLQKKGYLVVRDRISPGRGQLSSEYDFSPLVRKMNELFEEERSKRAIEQNPDWVVAERQSTPLEDSQGGGLEYLQGGPLEDSQDEEDEVLKKTNIEKDKNKDSNNFELLTQKSQNGTNSKFSKKRKRNDQNSANGLEVEPLAKPRGRGELRPIATALEARIADLRASAQAANGQDQPPRRGRPPKYPATAAMEALITDWTTELHDDPDHARSNVSQAARLWHESGVSEDTFRDLLYDARRRTKGAGNVEKLAEGGAGEMGLRNRMPYFFACLKKIIREDLQRQVQDRAPSTGKGKSSRNKVARAPNVYG